MMRDKADTVEPDGGDSERPSTPRRRFLQGGLAAAPAVFTMRQSYAAIGSAVACVARNAQDFQETKPAALAGTAVDSWVRVPWIYFEFVSEASSGLSYFLAPTAEVRSQIDGDPADGDYYLTDSQGVAFAPLKTVRLTRSVVAPIDNASPPTDPACAVESSTSTGGLSTGYESPTRRGKPDRSMRGFDGRTIDQPFDSKRRDETSGGRRDRSRRGVATTPPEASAATDPCASAGSGATTTTTTDERNRRYRSIDRPQNGAGDRIRNSGGGSTTFDRGSLWTSSPSGLGATGFAETPGSIVGKARRADPMEDPGAAPLARGTDRDTDRASRDRGRRDRGMTAPLPVESPAAPVVEPTVLPPTTPSGTGGAYEYAIDASPGLFFMLVGEQRETNILRLYNAATGDPVQAVGDSTTYTALTASCHVSINPNAFG